jgi:hypothetical protein
MQPSGCVTSLDFATAYDKMQRSWVPAVFQAFGFGPYALRWISLLLEGTCAIVRFGNGYSRTFAVDSGVAQGSPLSPLLFVAAVQPLAARLWHLQAAGRIDAIRLPDGKLAPPSHQHADDITLHTATADGAARALDLAVDPFCAASGSKLNRAKSKAITLGSHPPLVGPHPLSGVEFLPPGEPFRHLGILLTTGDRGAAAADMWAQRLTAVAARLQHWRGVGLTYAGRVHVAKQVLAAALVHVATFVAPPPQQRQPSERNSSAMLADREGLPALVSRFR